MTSHQRTFSTKRRAAAWLVHLFTASGAVFALLTFNAIHHGQYILAFWFMGAAIAIDSFDGTLARWANTKEAAAKIDGALLDNIIDYANYVLAPAFFLVVSDLLPPYTRLLGASIVVLASAYQFTQPDAKTKDHFFKGFPSYWNIVVFYLFFWQMSPLVNLTIVLLLAVLVFVPIKYVYPSRLDYLSHNLWVQWAMFIATLLWGAATAALLWIYPATNRLLVALSVGYAVCYALVSIYRTFVPLDGVALDELPRRKIFIPGRKERTNVQANRRPG
ncbi:MAG: phosphatidylcholine synthase [Chloroflexi bacterium]|nr:MAG: phosphatidylcholine synthase [Chloroflexota bacterium]